MPLLYLVVLFVYPVPNSHDEVDAWLPRGAMERAEAADFLLAVCRVHFEIIIAELKTIKGDSSKRERELRRTAVALLIAIDRLNAAKNPEPRTWLPTLPSALDPFDPANKLKPRPKPPVRD